MRDERRQKFLKCRPNGAGSAAAGGSVSSTFYAPDDTMDEKPTKTSSSTSGSISPKTLHRLKMESLQIVCNYLSDEWTTKLIDSFEMSADEVFQDPAAKRLAGDSPAATTAVRSVSRETDTATPAKDVPKSKKVEPGRSIANKSLEKVNKRGMSALTSFFKPKAKKPAL
jgi:hypothetical protein